MLCQLVEPERLKIPRIAGTTSDAIKLGALMVCLFRFVLSMIISRSTGALALGLKTYWENVSKWLLESRMNSQLIPCRYIFCHLAASVGQTAHTPSPTLVLIDKSW